MNASTIVKACHCSPRFSIFAVLLGSLLVSACGPEATSYTPISDTISSTGSIVFDSSTDTIHVTEKGPSVQSREIDECALGFDKEILPFALKSAEELVLDNQTVEYIRPLAQPASVPGIDDRLFAVWKVPSHTVGLVSYNIEIEIHADQIIYRNTCVR